MLSSAVRAFSDADEYGAAIRAANTEFTVTGRGHFAAKLVRVDLHQVWLQWASENLPRISHSTNIAGRAVISFRTRPGPALLTAALEMQPTNIVRHSEAQSYHRRSSGLADYCSMSLPLPLMASFGAAVAGIDLLPPKDPLLHTPPRSAIAKLQRLHAAAVRLAQTAPEIITNPDAARGLEQLLIEAMVGCLGDGERRAQRLAQGQHAIVMRRFHRMVEEHPEQPLYIPDICKAIGVAERTLRMCCQEHLGMSPKRYLMLRRMHLARWEHCVGRRLMRHRWPPSRRATASGSSDASPWRTRWYSPSLRPSHSIGNSRSTHLFAETA